MGHGNSSFHVPASSLPSSGAGVSRQTQKSVWPRPLTPAPVTPGSCASCVPGAGPSHIILDLPFSSLPVMTRRIGVSAILLSSSGDALDGKRLAVHLDRAVERNLLRDQPLGETARPGVLQQVRDPVRGRVTLDREMRIDAVPAVVDRAFD